MSEAREVANAYLTNNRKLELKADPRKKLVARGLINVRKEGRFYFLELSERGWGWCREQLDAEVPPQAGHGGAAAYAILNGLRRFLDRQDLSLADLFERPADAEPATGDIEARIRKAYGELAPEPGAWVGLVDIRSRLGALARPDVDRVLVRMNRGPDVRIVPESGQKTLTDQDREAAVSIGNQDRHLIAIGS
ncbi:MAG TPA: hypothetical protein VFM55_07860 [Micromonosporaceae bacterium]|nr:hypothetical protein [Micromonosporaceae bacterium]